MTLMIDEIKIFMTLFEFFIFQKIFKILLLVKKVFTRVIIRKDFKILKINSHEIPALLLRIC
jgi:hypothetical protein